MLIGLSIVGSVVGCLVLILGKGKPRILVGIFLVLAGLSGWYFGRHLALEKKQLESEKKEESKALLAPKQRQEVAPGVPLGPTMPRIAVRTDGDNMVGFDSIDRHLRAGENEAAAKDYQVLLGIYNGLLQKPHHSSYIDRGKLHWIMMELELAAADFTDAIRLDPKKANAHYYRGFVLDQMGSRTEAFADYKRFLELAPDSPHAAFAQYRTEQMQ